MNRNIITFEGFSAGKISDEEYLTSVSRNNKKSNVFHKSEYNADEMVKRHQSYKRASAKSATRLQLISSDF